MDKTRTRLITLVAVLSVILGGLIGGVAAKYVWSTEVSGTILFSAKLADSIALLAHKAEKNTDGSYTLLTEETVPENTYTLLPGLDIPKDPYILIEGKTPVPAYLFVEVLDNTTNGAITYSMTNQWKALGITGKNGGTVYVFTTDGTTPAEVDETVGEHFTVSLLEGNQITVGQELLASATNDSLKFYACMGETAFSTKTDPVAKATEVYQKLNNIP